MLHCLLVSKDPAALAGLASALSTYENVQLYRVASAKWALKKIKSGNVDVVVTAAEVAEGEALPFVEELVKTEPLINCAMVSALPPKDFHEATEGLGVFMQLPPDPGGDDAAKMMQHIDSIGALMGA